MFFFDFNVECRRKTKTVTNISAKFDAKEDALDFNILVNNVSTRNYVENHHSLNILYLTTISSQKPMKLHRYTTLTRTVVKNDYKVKFKDEIHENLTTTLSAIRYYIE